MQLPKHTRTFDLIKLSSFYLSKPKSRVAFVFMEGQSRSCSVSLFIKCMGVSYLIALAGWFGCGIFTSPSLFHRSWPQLPLPGAPPAPDNTQPHHGSSLSSLRLLPGSLRPPPDLSSSTYQSIYLPALRLFFVQLSLVAH